MDLIWIAILLVAIWFSFQFENNRRREVQDPPQRGAKPIRDRLQHSADPNRDRPQTQLAHLQGDALRPTVPMPVPPPPPVPPPYACPSSHAVEPAQERRERRPPNGQAFRFIAKPRRSSSGQNEREVGIAQEAAVCIFCDYELEVGCDIFLRRCNCPGGPILADIECANANGTCDECNTQFQYIPMTLCRAPAARRR